MKICFKNSHGSSERTSEKISSDFYRKNTREISFQNLLNEKIVRKKNF